MQLRGMLRGGATVLGDAASDIELFLTDDLITRCAHLQRATCAPSPAVWMLAVIRVPQQLCV